MKLSKIIIPLISIFYCNVVFAFFQTNATSEVGIQSGTSFYYPLYTPQTMSRGNVSYNITQDGEGWWWGNIYNGIGSWTQIRLVVNGQASKTFIIPVTGEWQIHFHSILINASHWSECDGEWLTAMFQIRQNGNVWVSQKNIGIEGGGDNCIGRQPSFIDFTLSGQLNTGDSISLWAAPDSTAGGKNGFVLSIGGITATYIGPPVPQ